MKSRTINVIPESKSLESRGLETGQNRLVFIITVH